MSCDDLEEPFEAFAALFDDLVCKAAVERSGCSLRGQPHVRQRRQDGGDGLTSR